MELFVRRPVISVVLALVLLLAGALATRIIPVTQFPGLESASLVINTEYTGASADVVQGFITAPIERVARTVPGVDYVDSTTTAGSSKVTAWLKLNQDSNAALAELSSRLSQIDYELPDEAQSPSVSITRTDRAFAIFYLDVSSPQLDRAELTDYLSRRVVPQLAGLPGVQRVDIEGGRKPAMRIWLDPVRLASLQLGADEVLAALRRNNIVAATGKTESRG
ncbi:MAG: efflux RND transporter permease subunit, partial [Porticoccaceae bacterium]|nr:efflux RND transporter permease subunit [Porticoccaceae bacterium]